MASPIKPDDSSEERITKLLPADVTAAFLSAKAALVAFFGTPDDAPPVFWTFVTILVLCPFYFWFVTKVTNYFQIGFLCLTFIVFGLSIADLQFINYFPNYQVPIKIISIVLPVLWAFLISRIFIGALGKNVEG
jgi:hypothetical protein